MADNAVLPCSFDEHLELIQRAIEAEYYRTEIVTLSETMSFWQSNAERSNA